MAHYNDNKNMDDRPSGGGSTGGGQGGNQGGNKGRTGGGSESDDNR